MKFLGGGGSGNAKYSDLTYRPNATGINPPIYSNFNTLYTAIQANTSNSIITRLWLDDSLNTNDNTSRSFWSMGF